MGREGARRKDDLAYPVCHVIDTRQGRAIQNMHTGVNDYGEHTGHTQKTVWCWWTGQNGSRVTCVRFPLKIDFVVLKPFFRVYMKFLTESENGMNEETQQGLKSLFRAPLTQ